MLLKANIITSPAPSRWVETLMQMKVGDVWTLKYKESKDKRGDNLQRSRIAIYRLRKKPATAHLCFATRLRKKENSIKIFRKKDRV